MFALDVLRGIADAVDHALVARLAIRGYTSRLVPTSVGDLHVVAAPGGGPLPPVVVLHGFAAAAHYYAGVMERIRPHVRRVIGVDLPGHGFSVRPRSLRYETVRAGLVDVLDATLDEPTVFFGNSLGGGASLRYAIHRRSRARGLFLVAPGAARMDAQALAELVSRFRLETPGEALDFVDRLFERPHPFRHFIALGTRHQFRRPGLFDLLRDARVEDLHDPADLATLRCPIHLVWGAADRVLPRENLEFFERALPPHAKIELVREYGHVPHMDHPVSLHERFLAFVRHCARTPRLDSAGWPDFPTDSGVGAP